MTICACLQWLLAVPLQHYWAHNAAERCARIRLCSARWLMRTAAPKVAMSQPAMTLSTYICTISKALRPTKDCSGALLRDCATLMWRQGQWHHLGRRHGLACSTCIDRVRPCCQQQAQPIRRHLIVVSMLRQRGVCAPRLVRCLQLDRSACLLQPACQHNYGHASSYRRLVHADVSAGSWSGPRPLCRVFSCVSVFKAATSNSKHARS